MRGIRSESRAGSDRNDARDHVGIPARDRRNPHLEDVPIYEIRYQAEDAIRNDMKCYRGRGQWTSYVDYPVRTVTKVVAVRPPYIGQDSKSYAAESPPKELWGKAVEQTLYNVSVTCTGITPQWWWWMAALPALFMALVGYVVRWIYRGFRPKP